VTIKFENTFLAIILIISILLFSVNAQDVLPSDLITKQKAPTKLDLSNTAPSSAKAINELNTKLSKQPKWVMADIGYLHSDSIIKVKQADNDVTVTALTEFMNGNEALPESIVGNLTDYNNITVINGTMTWY